MYNINAFYTIIILINHESIKERGNKMSKKNIAVVFGGCSSEHEVSCISVQTIIKSINSDSYNVLLVGITDKGHWLLVDKLEDIASGEWRQSQSFAIISPDTSRELIVKTKDEITYISIDVVFPVLHGLNGEDGTIQGLFQMAQIPYVGCGVLSSAVSMDKLYTKIIVDTLGINQAKYVPVLAAEFDDMKAIIDKIEKDLPYPVFVKPSNAGSSKGVSKASNREELLESLNEAVKHDSKILVEETIVGRELECAILGYGKETKASGIGEILPAATAAFYDFEAKYFNAESQTVIGPILPEGKEEEIRQAAIRIFRAVDGFGLSRVDFFMEKGTDRIVFNEINTLPGFTSISMYPMLWEAKGISKENLVNTLIEMAAKRTTN